MCMCLDNNGHQRIVMVESPVRALLAQTAGQPVDELPRELRALRIYGLKVQFFCPLASKHEL